MADKQKKNSRKWLTITAFGVIIIALIIIALFVFDSGNSKDSIGPTTFVKQGPLTITVSEGGTIESHDQLVIKDKVRGTRTLIYLIDEGTMVKKGDLLAQLDSSDLEDQLVDQEISVENAQAALVQANQELEITKSQNKSDIAVAKQTYEFAKIDYHKYLDGEYPQDLEQAQSDITLAQEKLKQAETTLNWSKKLHEKQYISDSELQSDQLSYDQAKMSVKLKEGALNLLTKYTYKRQVAQLKSDIEQDKMSLDRTERQAQANLVQSESSVRAKKAEYRRQKNKLDDLNTRIKNCNIYAPRDGMVIYATTGSSHRRNQEPLAEGQQVHMRQELIDLPHPGSMVANIKVHESNIDKVKVGQPVQVTVDAYPGRYFTGTVTKIAPLPDATSAWLNPDLKVYNTTINLTGDVSGLRTGMSCQSTIIIDHYASALSVPVQAVVRIGNQPVVFVVKDGKKVAQNVTLGLDNNTVVRIVKGLSAGQRILLAPPLSVGKTDGSKRYAGVLKNSKDSATSGDKQAQATSGGSADKAADSKKKNEEKNLNKLLEKAKEKGYTPPTAKEVEQGKKQKEKNDQAAQPKVEKSPSTSLGSNPAQGGARKHSRHNHSAKSRAEWAKKHPDAVKRWAKKHPDAAKKWEKQGESHKPNKSTTEPDNEGK